MDDTAKEGAVSEAKADDSDDLSLAIAMAKEFLLKAFKDERIQNVGLEEVQHDPYRRIWDITLGFNRPAVIAPNLPNTFLQAAAAAAAARPPRVYKVVRIDMDGPQAVSITNRKDD